MEKKLTVLIQTLLMLDQVLYILLIEIKWIKTKISLKFSQRVGLTPLVYLVVVFLIRLFYTLKRISVCTEVCGMHKLCGI